jgi:hypothetical protein
MPARILENPAGMIYGTLVVAALLDAESVASEHYADTIGAVVVAMVLYWLAHAYADFAGERLERRESIHLGDLARALGKELAILLGAAVPLLAVSIVGLAGGSLNAAVNAGIYSAAGMLLVIELAAGMRADLTPVALMIQSLFGAFLGAVVIALKILLH